MRRDILIVLFLISLVFGSMQFVRGIGLSDPAFIALLQRGAISVAPNSLFTNLWDGWIYYDGNSSALSPTSYNNGYASTNINTTLITNNGGVGGSGPFARYISANTERFELGTSGGDVPALERTGSLSIAFWVKPLGGTNSFHYLITKGTNNGSAANNTDWVLRISPTFGGTIEFFYGYGSGNFATNTGARLITNNFHHVVMVHSNGVGGSFRIYTNGVLAKAWTNRCESTFASNGPLRWGRVWGNGTGSPLNGGIAWNHYWLRGISPSEVNNLYTNELAGITWPNWKP